MEEPIISVSGLRGIVGRTLTPEVAIRYVRAFAAELPAGPIVVARDGRDSGPMLAEAIHSGLVASGRMCIDVGIAATPTVGVLVSEHQAAGGVQISASHNPPEYNGIKLFSSEGRVISADAGEKVAVRYRDDGIPGATHDALGEISDCSDTITRHWELVREIVNVKRIRAREFHVVLDSNRASGSLLGRHLLAELGCRFTLLGDLPDGKFEHPPEPTKENLAGVLKSVADAKADVGFCQDPDADRLAVIDAAGEYLGEEYTLALCVDHVLRSRQGPIVTNCSTSRMSEDLATKYGVDFFRSPVGEANVIDVMLQHNAVLGGEGNGGVIDPRVVLVRDSFVSMALLLDAMASRDMPISALAAEFPRYEICKTKIALAPEKIPVALDALEKHFPDASADRMDGLRLDWPGKWLLVRASNTEPIVRAISESGTAAESRRLCDQAAQVFAGL